MLRRQFSRTKKAGVNPKTWLANHSGLCKLVLPAVPLLAVVASAGRWQLVPIKVQQLMAHSALGKTIFNMAGLAVNVHAYGRFPNLYSVFWGGDPGTLKSDIVSKTHPQLIGSDLRFSN